MERTMSMEDKIRRAEEIYYRRREAENPTRETIRRPKSKKKDIKLLRKMIIQIMLCLTIYSIVYLIVNNNYIFSEDFTNKAKEILSQDINFSEIYSIISNKINEFLKQPQEQQEEQKNEENRIISTSRFI